MRRLIDADMLKSAIARYSEKLLSHKYLSIVKNAIREVLYDINFAIDVQPTIDSVPVVRCKDCKNNSKHGGTCDHICIDPNDEWFCADGEEVTP